MRNITLLWLTLLATGGYPATAMSQSCEPSGRISEPTLYPARVTDVPREFRRPAPFARFRTFHRRAMFHAPMKAPTAAEQAMFAEAASKARGLMSRNPAWNIDEGTTAFGIYEVPLSGKPTSFTLLKDLNSLKWTFMNSSGCVYTPDGFYLQLTDYNKGQINGKNCYLLDPETFEITREWYVNSDNEWIKAGAYDPTSGIVYANFTHAEVNNNYAYYGTFDVTTGQSTSIKRVPFDDNLYNIYEMAITSDGQLYGLMSSRDEKDMGVRYLYKIDKNTGDVSKVAKTGLPTNLFETSAVIDPTDTYMYVSSGGSDYNTTCALYSVKLSDGTATKLYDYPDNEGFKSIFIPTKPDNGAPRSVTDLKAEFTDDALSGSVSFRMPSFSVGGFALSGNIDYSLTVNGGTPQTGKATAGQTVSVPVTVAAGGNYTIAVRASNTKGYSPATTIKTYIGRDVPALIKNVRIRYENGEFVVDWDAPTSLNGGFFEPSKLRYKVLLYAYDVQQASQAATTFRYRLDTPADYFLDTWFTIVPLYDGKEFSGTSSPHKVIGNMALPYASDFAANATGYRFVNANGDHRAWVREWRYDGYLKLEGNTYEPHDDWMIAPPANMEAGKAYRLELNIRAHMPEYPERFSIWAGNDSTVEAMTHLLQPEKLLYDQERDHVEHVYFAPKQSGKYHFAVHATTEANYGTLYIDQVRIGAPVSARLAAEMTDFELKRSEAGDLKAILSFTAPKTDLGGNPVSSIDKIEIQRDGTVIAEIPATPGQKLTYEDTTVPENGTYTYSVAAWTSEGRGIEAVRKTFIGVKVPSSMKSITVKRGVDNGHFVIEWDSDPVDINGDPFDPETLKYNLYRDVYGEQTLIAEGLSEKKKVYRVCEPDAEQILTFFGVEPVNTAGTGYGIQSRAIPAGRPDAIPYQESFRGKAPHHLYWIDYHPYYYATWLFAGDSDFNGIRSQDGDNGFLVFGSEDANNVAYYVSANVDMSGAENPVFTYYYYTWEYGNTIELQIYDGTEWKTVDSFATNDDYNANGNNEEWVRRSVDMSAYKGQTIQWQLKGKCVDGMYSLLDNIYIGQSRDTDLSVGAISAPTRVKGGALFSVGTRVYNFGAKTSPAYTVNLLVDGKVAESVERSGLDTGRSKTENFRCRINLGDEPSHTYRIEVVTEGDEDTSNNSTGEATVSRSETIYPEPANLRAEYAVGAAGVNLTWDAPDLSGTRRLTVTDDVEDYTDFSIGMPDTDLPDDNTGDWTMADLDDAVTYTFNGGNYPNLQAKMAYIVFNPTAAGLDFETSSIWKPYSGEKMFASFLPVRLRDDEGNETRVDKDDWLISPLLTGDAQTISFRAKTMSPTYSKETFEVYYTTADTPDPSAMVKAGETAEADYEWGEFSFELPAGAKYFAIRNFGADGFVFLVDDIVYQPGAAAGMGLTLQGYNVYRDNVLLTADAPAKGNAFTDAEGNDSRRITYQVTAVYDRGESMPARTEIGFDGLGFAADSTVKAYGADGYIIVEGASGLPVRVYATDGSLCRSIESGAQLTRIPAARGIYIVTAGNRSFKVIVG